MPDDVKERPPRYEKAIALQYDDLQELPRVTATGRGEVAKRIVALAEQHHVPVQRNDTLVELLSTLSHNQQIPTESYTLVAEVISFLYHVDKKWREQHGFLEPVLGGDRS